METYTIVFYNSCFSDVFNKSINICIYFRDGLLTVQSVKWTESFYTNFEDYLQDNLKASAGFYPMMYGLCLAEDFTLGTW